MMILIWCCYETYAIVRTPQETMTGSVNTLWQSRQYSLALGFSTNNSTSWQTDRQSDTMNRRINSYSDTFSFTKKPSLFYWTTAKLHYLKYCINKLVKKCQKCKNSRKLAPIYRNEENSEIKSGLYRICFFQIQLGIDLAGFVSETAAESRAGFVTLWNIN